MHPETIAALKRTPVDLREAGIALDKRMGPWHTVWCAVRLADGRILVERDTKSATIAAARYLLKG